MNPPECDDVWATILDRHRRAFVNTAMKLRYFLRQGVKDNHTTGELPRQEKITGPCLTTCEASSRDFLQSLQGNAGRCVFISRNGFLPDSSK